MAIAINVKVYMRDGWFIPVPIKVGIIHVLGLLSTASYARISYGVTRLLGSKSVHLILQCTYLTFDS
jgi:hypothetical protein